MDSNTPQKNARKHRENIEYLDCLLDAKALPQFCQQLWGAGVLWERQGLVVSVVGVWVWEKGCQIVGVGVGVGIGVWVWKSCENWDVDVRIGACVLGCGCDDCGSGKWKFGCGCECGLWVGLWVLLWLLPVGVGVAVGGIARLRLEIRRLWKEHGEKSANRTIGAKCHER